MHPIPSHARTKTRSGRTFATAAVLLLGLAACGSGGGGGAPPILSLNLTGTGLKSLSAEPMAGHEMTVEVALAASGEARDVGLAFYVINKSDLDDEVDEPRQFLVDESVLPVVPAGNSTHQATLIVPADLQPIGKYVLVARIDPMDLIRETNEEDNLPGAGSPDIVIDIDDSLKNTPDLTLESVTLDTPSAVLEQNQNLGTMRGLGDVPNHHFGATALIRTTCALAQSRLEMSVALEVSSGSWQALQIWEPNLSRHVTSWFVPELRADQPNDVHLDVMIPEALRTRLIQDIERSKQNVYNLRFTLNGGNSIKEWENGCQRFQHRADNEIVVQIALVPPGNAPSTGIAWAEDFHKFWANSTFGVGVDFHAGTSVDKRGLIGELNAAVPVRLFKQDFDFVSSDLYARAAPHDTTQSRFSFDVKVVGVSVYSKLVVDPVYEWNETPFKAVKSIEKRSIVFVGPVPIELRAGATGEIGVNLKFRVDTKSATLEGQPYFTLSAFASAGVNLVAVSAGIRGDVELLGDTLTAATTAELAITNAGRYLDGRILLNATNELRGPSGRLYLFVTYPGVKLCKVLGATVPCGIVTHRKEHTIAKFETFKKNDVLFNKGFTAFRVDLQN